MAKPDPLLRWETEAMRESAERRRKPDPAQPTPTSHDPAPPEAAGNSRPPAVSPAQTEAPDTPGPTAATRSRSKEAWVTLREAHYMTGLPIETLRKWARRRHVPSELRRTEFGERRVIDVVAVEARAHRLGRPLSPIPQAQREAEETYLHPQPDTNLEPDPTTSAHHETRVPRASETPPGPPPDTETTQAAASAEVTVTPTSVPTSEVEPGPETTTPPGTMIIPIAAWDRVLMQLGNLHQAGQQLAEARERAARAETEASFLRERLAELRRQIEPTEPPHAPQAPTVTPPGVDAPPAPGATHHTPPEKLWRYVYRGWRARRN